MRLSDLINDLRATAQEFDAAKVTPGKYPGGWEPGVEMEGESGTLVTRPSTDPTPRFEDELKSWGFDPELYEVVEPINFRTWEAWGGAEVGTIRLTYYKADIRSRRRGVAVRDAQELVAQIRKHRKRKRVPPSGEHAFVYVVADTQMGKDGSGDTARRWLDSLDMAQDRIRDLRSLGVGIGEGYVLGLGDIVEGCDGFYPMQAYTVELNRRDQVKISIRLISKTITTLAPEFERFGVLAVGGNHGENRKKGKAFTDFGDNDDLLVFEVAYDHVKMNPDAYGHVRAKFPDTDLTLSVDIAGTSIGLAHGHQARRGGSTPQQKIEAWWKDQMFGRRSVADVDVLLTGHYHHYSMIEDGERTWIQAPALDSGSQWWEEQAGRPTRPGVLTFTLSNEGVDNVKVLRP